MRALLRRVTHALVLLACSWGSAARAQPLADGDHRVDLVDLPILGAPRAVGVGGAFGALGEGVSALPWNPAAAAARGYWEHDWFEWELTLGALFPTKMDASRFFGGRDDGNLPTEDFTFYDVGLRLQFGPAAFGVLVRPRSFDAEVATLGQVSITAQTAHLDLAWALHEGTWVVGAGVRVVGLAVVDPEARPLLAIRGANVEAGVTYRPTGETYRLSTVVRAPIDARRIEASAALDAVRAVPRSVNVPWELALSGVYGFGERPLDATIFHAPRPRERRRLEREASAAVRPEEPEVAPAEPRDPPVPPPDPPRTLRPRYGLVTAELVVQGRTRDGIGLDGFLEEQRRTAGARVTVSPRIGIEGEPWRNRMKLRAGTYLEPARSSSVAPRMHFTHGFDLRLFDTRLFGLLDEPLGIQVTFIGDVARQYATFGVGVGIFH